MSMPSKMKIRVIPWILPMLLGACSLMPEYLRPQAPIPAQYPTTGSSDTSVSALAPLSWQAYFADPDLQGLIAIALQHNRDLKTAVLRIDEARASYGIARAEQLPAIQGNLGFDRSKTVFTADQSFQVKLFRAGIGLSEFEIDVFGRVKSLSQAALQSYLASSEVKHSVIGALVSEIATQYVNYLALEAQLQVTQRTLVDRQQSLQRIQRRFDAGIDQMLDLKAAQIQVEQVQAQQAQWQRQLATTRNTLLLLLGEPSHSTVLPSKPLTALQLGDAPIGLPSDLLTRRADIRAAEHMLQAANANIGAARAAFYPRLQLTTNAGLVNPWFSQLFADPGHNYWTFSPQLILPIFNAGRNQAALSLAETRAKIEVANYEKTIQTAFKEVMDVLVARGNLLEEAEAKMRTQSLERDRLQLVKRKLEQGLANYLELLDAQRSVLEAESQQLEIQQLQLLNQVALYRALGGS